jgi:multiple sugar transport system permease protein
MTKGVHKSLARFVDKNMGIFFVLPALVAIALLMVFPVAYNIYMSFHRWFLGGTPSYVGIGNYARLLTKDPRFINSLVVTVKYVIPSVILCVGLGLALALLINRQFRMKGFVRTILLLPMLATPAAMAVVWMIMYEPSLGIFNYVLKLIGISPQLWVNSSQTVIPSLVLIEVWKWIPLPMMIILAALQSLPASPYEAAAIDGANKWQTFSKITLPLLKPTIMTAIMLRTIDCLKAFDIIFVMTNGGPDIASETLEMYTYKTAFAYFELGYGSAMALVLTSIILVVSWVLAKGRERSWSY